MTHSRVRIRLSEVLPMAPSPSMHVHPSHHIEDMGAMFAVPSSLSVEMMATGVPKHRIVGSIVLCMRGS